MNSIIFTSSVFAIVILIACFGGRRTHAVVRVLFIAVLSTIGICVALSVVASILPVFGEVGHLVGETWGNITASPEPAKPLTADELEAYKLHCLLREAALVAADLNN